MSKSSESIQDKQKRRIQKKSVDGKSAGPSASKSNGDQLQADAALLNRSLGNQAIQRLVEGSAGQSKAGGSGPAGLQQILNRQVAGGPLQRFEDSDLKDKKKKVEAPTSMADAVAGQADQTSAAFEVKAGDKSTVEQQGYDSEKTNLDVVAGTGDTFVGLKAVADAVSAYKEKSGADAAEAALAGAEGGAKVVAGSTKMVDSGAKAGGSEDGVGASDLAGKITGTIADSLSTIKEGFTLFKTGWETFRNFQKNKKVDKAAMAGMAVTATKGIQAGFKMVKGWFDMVKGGAPTEVISGIPVMGLIINGIDVMIRAYDYFKSWRSNEALGKMSSAPLEVSGEETLRKDLIKIGAKRKTRAITDISKGLLSVVGDILNLSGAGVIAGTASKMTAGAAGAAQTGFRNFKQWLNDKAANGSPKFKKFAKAMGGNEDKSMNKKNDTRREDAETILKFVKKANDNGVLDVGKKQAGNDDGKKAQLNKLEIYVDAAGSSFEELGDIGNITNTTDETYNTAKNHLMDAMAKR